MGHGDRQGEEFRNDLRPLASSTVGSSWANRTAAPSAETSWLQTAQVAPSDAHANRQTSASGRFPR